MFWKVLSRTLHSIFGIGGLVMQGFGIYFDIIEVTQTLVRPFGLSILNWGIILFDIVAISIIAQLWWHIHKIEVPTDAIIQELESKIIHRMAYSDKVFSMLGIFDALRDNFALGLSYPQIHGVLKDKLERDTVWGFYSSNILAILTTMGLIHAPTIDPSSSVFLDNKYTIPQYVYELTDKGKVLAHKLMSQKLKTDKEDSRKK